MKEKKLLNSLNIIKRSVKRPNNTREIMKNGERFLLGSQICLYLSTKGITIMDRPLYLQGIVAFNRIFGRL